MNTIASVDTSVSGSECECEWWVECEYKYNGHFKWATQPFSCLEIGVELRVLQITSFHSHTLANEGKQVMGSTAVGEGALIDGLLNNFKTYKLCNDS